jgi:CheY-like chemotaxis protein
MNKSNSEYQKPSERAARFVLGIFGWIRHITGSSRTVIPHGYAVRHLGRELPIGASLRFPAILIVEDNPDSAQDFISAVKEYYQHGSVTIFIAHAYDAAVTFFQNEEINLVIMDSDLDDIAGDGVTLTRLFLSDNQDLVILANSSSLMSNHKLTGFGAADTLGKNPEKLKSWLLTHDPAGQSVDKTS